MAKEEITTSNRFGSVPYSQEELVAELGAAFLRNIASIDSDPVFQNSASYIEGWLSRLKDDKQLIFKASVEAQKAVDYIVGENFDDVD